MYLVTYKFFQSQSINQPGTETQLSHLEVLFIFNLSAFGPVSCGTIRVVSSLNVAVVVVCPGNTRYLHGLHLLQCNPDSNRAPGHRHSSVQAGRRHRRVGVRHPQGPACLGTYFNPDSGEFQTFVS